MRARDAVAVIVTVGLACLACAACGGGERARPAAPRLLPSGPPLPAPTVIDPATRGAAYLVALGAQLQPPWAQFLEDCRLRLPASHPLNAPGLEATVELAIAPDGTLAELRIVRGSGNGDFDTAVIDVLGDVTPLPRPPAELESDDALVHVRWLFARDRRQAGPATAVVMTVELPLVATVAHLLARGAFARAAARVARASEADGERLAAAERVMIAAVARGLASRDGAVRIAALDAVARARLRELAPAVQRRVALPAEASERIAAIRAAERLADGAVAPVLVADLRADLAARPSLALAKIAALVTIGRARDAHAVIRAELDARGPGAATALAALAHVPDPASASTLASWFASRDSRIRESICGALPAAAPARASALVGRGLRDGDAGVRASCADAAARQGRDADRATRRRLAALARDRDRAVRARATAALGTLGELDPARRGRAIEDAAPEVRAAAASGATELDLRMLARDRDPDVRAAALATLADRAPDLATAAIVDPAPQVRLAAIAGLADDAALARLAGDPIPEVATAALVRSVARRGRQAVTRELLTRAAAAPAAGVERVRIALAWLLAR